MADSNGTITVEELKKLLEEWNLVIGFLFLTWICLLQFAYANRNRFLYIIKLIFLWLLWPVTLTCFVLAAVYRINWITGGIAIAMACLVGLMWLSYFIASFRLFARTRSMWSFNPETNILLNVPLHGTILTRPLLESELVIGAVILRGHLRIAGHHLAIRRRRRVLQQRRDLEVRQDADRGARRRRQDHAAARSIADRSHSDRRCRGAERRRPGEGDADPEHQSGDGGARAGAGAARLRARRSVRGGA